MFEQALHVADILFEIFIHLSQKDLLLIQRVCRSWHNVITSTIRLQANLFLHPGISTTKNLQETLSPCEPKLNPLLRDRFPSFFDFGRQVAPIKSHRHDLGLWKSTEWYQGKHGKTRHPMTAKDKQRMAAYAYHNASWRRMIPFRPPPSELQVCFGSVLPGGRYGTLRGKLKCVKFSNEVSGNITLQQTWLTFGLLYDIVEQAWFRGSLHMDAQNMFPLSHVQFDYAQSDEEEPSKKSRAQSPFRSNDLPRLRSACPDKKIGGKGRMVVHLILRVSAPVLSKRNSTGYADEFKSKGSIASDIWWDEDVLIPNSGQGGFIHN